jgi:cation transporter-like permease
MDRLLRVTTSEIVSIVSVALPTMGAVLSAIASFVGVLPGTERRLHRLVSIHNDMPAGEGKSALEEAVNHLAVRTARRVVSTRVERQQQRRKVDAGKLIGIIIVILVGGGLAWGFWLLGTSAPWPFLQWTLWVIGILVTLFTTLVVTGMSVFKDDDEPARAVDDARQDAAG